MDLPEHHCFHNAALKGKVTMERRKYRGARTKAEKIRRLMIDWDARFEMSQPQFKQLKHLITKFGGITPFAVAIGVHPGVMLYQWLGVKADYTLTEDRPKGLLSIGYLARLIKVSRYWGILLTPEDLFPDLIEGGMVKIINEKDLASWIGNIKPKQAMLALEDTLALLVLTQD